MDMFTEVHTITISKLAKRSLRDGIAEADQSKLREGVTSRTLEVAGWRYVFGGVERTESEQDGFNWHYSYSVQVSHTNARSMQYGALASRFNNPVHFGRPDRATLQRILEREVKSVNGNLEWVAPALDFCDKHGITDPRRVISTCLLGADELLTGEYQADAEATMVPNDNDTNK